MKASRQTLSRSEDEEADGFLGKSSVEVGVLWEALEPLNTKLCVFGWREVCVCSVGGVCVTQLYSVDNRISWEADNKLAFPPRGALSSL